MMYFRDVTRVPLTRVSDEGSWISMDVAGLPSPAKSPEYIMNIPHLGGS